MTEQLENKTRSSESWLDFLASNRLAIYILIAIAAETLIGTLLPQRGPGLSEVQFRELSGTPGFWSAVAKLGFLDIFHSAWFYALILLFIVNITLCTIFNFRRLLRTGSSHGMELGPELLAGMEKHGEFKSKSLNEAGIRKLLRIKKKADTADGTYFYSESGWIHRFGAVITHLGILTLAFGAILGASSGLDGQMLIAEGDKSDEVQLRRGGTFELPFQVACNKFTVEFYENSRQPKTFRSDISFIPAQGSPTNQTIEVNHPGSYGKFRFFQSTYGQLPPRMVIKVTRRSDGKLIGPMRASLQKPLDLPDGGKFAVVNLDPDKFSSGVAVEIRQMIPNKPPEDFWIFLANPQFDESRGGDYIYALTDVDKGGFYTGLMVTRNPGVNIVWLGSAIGALGLLFAFFIPYRRTVVRLADGTVSVGYSDSRSGDITNQKMTEVIEALKGKRDNQSRS